MPARGFLDTVVAAALELPALSEKCGTEKRESAAPAA
jgi:hypothetical protein